MKQTDRRYTDCLILSANGARGKKSAVMLQLFISGAGAGGPGQRWFHLPEALSARMRRRRCFADTELDAAGALDCRQLFAAALPQPPPPPAASSDGGS